MTCVMGMRRQKEEGIKEGEKHLGRLVASLVTDGKLDVATVVSTDDALREKMYAEYHIK